MVGSRLPSWKPFCSLETTCSLELFDHAHHLNMAPFWKPLYHFRKLVLKMEFLKILLVHPENHECFCRWKTGNIAWKFGFCVIETCRKTTVGFRLFGAWIWKHHLSCIQCIGNAHGRCSWIWMLLGSSILDNEMEHANQRQCASIRTWFVSMFVEMFANEIRMVIHITLSIRETLIFGIPSIDIISSRSIAYTLDMENQCFNLDIKTLPNSIAILSLMDSSICWLWLHTLNTLGRSRGPFLPSFAFPRPWNMENFDTWCPKIVVIQLNDFDHTLCLIAKIDKILAILLWTDHILLVPLICWKTKDLTLNPGVKYRREASGLERISNTGRLGPNRCWIMHVWCWDQPNERLTDLITYLPSMPSLGAPALHNTSGGFILCHHLWRGGGDKI